MVRIPQEFTNSFSRSPTISSLLDLRLDMEPALFPSFFSFLEVVIVVLEVEVVTAISFLPIPARIYIENDLGYMIG